MTLWKLFCVLRRKHYCSACVTVR